MRVVVAPGGVPGVSSVAAARLLADGWARVRAHDTLSTVPLPDPCTPALEAVATAVPGCRPCPVVVADARGQASRVAWLRLPDGTALVDATVVAAPGGSAVAALELTTTYGVG
ncbi:MAG: glycerate kinase, partial [Actinomycetota bacterium]|nr:glycerate kinase [Actinomycetota bacterium]